MEELKAPIAPGHSEPDLDGPLMPAPEARLAKSNRNHRLLFQIVRRTVVAVVDHDCLNMAQSTAYSAIVALFPTLIVAAAIAGLLPDTAAFRFQLSLFFNRILPPGVGSLLDAYFQNTPDNTHSVRALVSAGFVSFLGASNVMATLMEGLRRAGRLPDNCWTFWQRRRRSFELVPLSLIPLAVASLLVVFGHAVTAWLATSITPDVRAAIYAIALLVRWSVALGASVGLIALIYHLGVPARAHTRGRGHGLVAMSAPASVPVGVAIAGAGNGPQQEHEIDGRPEALAESEALEANGESENPAKGSAQKERPRGDSTGRILAHAARLGKLGYEGSVLDHTDVLIPRAWVPVLPGAVVATAMWFLTTLAFGWYATRFANYREVYGSLGVGIALLFWLYIISLSVLCGAEFNAQFRALRGGVMPELQHDESPLPDVLR